jgi:hypothetical protein
MEPLARGTVGGAPSALGIETNWRRMLAMFWCMPAIS